MLIGAALLFRPDSQAALLISTVSTQPSPPVLLTAEEVLAVARRITGLRWGLR